MSGSSNLATAIAEQKERLMPCVHCGFCLPACPTYVRLGDEADSPRGRLHLMQAVVEGRLDPASEAFRTHIDRCLGCRACEPVCPSGVEYGILLEHARETAAAAAPADALTRLLLRLMRSRSLRGAFFLVGRAMRATGLAALGARWSPASGIMGKGRFGLAMLAGSAPWRAPARRDSSGPTDLESVDGRGAGANAGGAHTGPASEEPRRIGMLVGCVQDGLYGRVNAATERVLRVNGMEVVSVPGQDCCGALHAHAGALDEARGLARRNIEAFEARGLDAVVVNAAGCGAAMKHYGVLLEHDSAYAARATAFSERVRDLMEVLDQVGPRVGCEVSCRVAYDHPCHLLHAQGIREAPLNVLAAIPGVDVQVVRNADECCGGAGIYGVTHPELGGRIGADKIRAVVETEADAVTTPNPGCMMQVGAGLMLEGRRISAVHPVELLDESYRRAGYYTS